MGTEKNANYELVVKYLITRFLPPKALQRQKRYLRKRFYKAYDTKVRDVIFWINNMVEYIDKFPPFFIGQGLTDNDILKLV